MFKIKLNLTSCIIAIAVVLFALFFSAKRIINDRKEIKRLTHNQSILLKNDYETATLPDGRSSVSAEQLQLTHREFRKTEDSLLHVIEALRIKNSRIKEIMSATSRTNESIETAVHDSIILRDSVRLVFDTIPCLEYRDAWLTFDGCIRNSRFYGNISSFDTLNIVVHRVPKRFLFFRFGCKAVRMDIVSGNPHTRLTSAKYIELR